MSIKISNSGENTYLECPKKYDIKYRQKIYSKWKPSALAFGSASDITYNFILENFKMKPEKLIKEAIKKFDIAWEQNEDRNFGIIDLPKYEYLQYSKYDFDADLLEKEDWRELYKETNNPIQRYNEIRSLMEEVQFKNLPSADRMFYNFCNWLSLKRKARYMIKAYVNDLLPHIDEVLEVQKDLSTTDGENTLTGIADFVCKLKPGTYGRVTLEKAEVVIPDNKTSSMEYSESSVETSQQLTKYKVMCNEKHPEWNITKGAYFVISKKLQKEKTKTCKVCGHVSDSSHKTCNNEIDGKRCNGAWDVVVKIAVPTQLVVQEIPEIFTNIVMENVDDVITCIKAGVFPRNFSACEGKYGTPCEYFSLCHQNRMDDLVKGENK